jgi:iron complex transport system permease protein
MTGCLSALTMFTQYLANFTDTFRTVRWLMGMLDVGSYEPILTVLPMLIVSFAMFATLPRALDLISMGTDAAAARASTSRAPSGWRSSAHRSPPARRFDQRADRVHRPRRPASRPPVRRLDHRLVLPASALFGAVFLIGCDLVARTAFAPIELPVGIITAVIGGPFFSGCW